MDLFPCDFFCHSKKRTCAIISCNFFEIHDIIDPVSKEAVFVDDKTFELMEKMYNEFGIFKKDMTEFRNETNKRFDTIDGHIMRIENEHGKKLDALFDGYRQTYEKLQEHDKRFDDVETKLDNLSIQVNGHESKLKVLGGGRNK